MKKLRNAIIYQGPPLFMAFGFYLFGAPWYAIILVLILAVYWYGPMFIYLKQRIPTVSPVRLLGADETLPSEHSRYFDKTVPLLQSMGFVYLEKRFVLVDNKQSIKTTGTLMQHQETSDIAHLLIATQPQGAIPIAETFGFSRARSDGSKITTFRATIQSPFPPNPDDNVLRIDGRASTADLWRVHQARVAADTGAIRNKTVTDAFGFQMELEREGTLRRIASGYWQQDERPEFIRPTAKGAVLMCFRMLPPWKQFARIRARLQMRRYLRGTMLHGDVTAIRREF